MRQITAAGLGLALISTFGLSHARAASLPEVALGPVVTSSGVGLEAMTPLIPGRLNLNIGFAGWGIADKMDLAGTHFSGKIRLGTVPLYLSWYPFRNGFNLQAGIYFTSNRLSVFGAAPVDGTVRIAHHTYTAAELGTISGASKFNPVAPYLGLGDGQPFAGGPWSFTASVGWQAAPAERSWLSASGEPSCVVWLVAQLKLRLSATGRE